MAAPYDDSSFCAAALGGAGRGDGAYSVPAGPPPAPVQDIQPPPLLYPSIQETVEQLHTRQVVLQAAVESCELLYRLGVLDATGRSGAPRPRGPASDPPSDDLIAAHRDSYARSSRLVRWAALDQHREAVLGAAVDARAEALGQVARWDVGPLRVALTDSFLTPLEAAASELAGIDLNARDSAELTHRDLERVIREFLRVASGLPQALQPVLQPFLARVRQAASWFDVGALRRELAGAMEAVRLEAAVQQERIDEVCKSHSREWEAAIEDGRTRSLESKERHLNGAGVGPVTMRSLPFEDDGWRKLREGLLEKMRAPADQLLRALRDAPVVPGDTAVVLREAARRAGGTGS